MKLSKKQRLTILERAYDKAAKVLPGQKGKLAEVEGMVLAEAISYSAELGRIRRREYRGNVWQHFGWDEPAASEQYSKLLKDIRNGQ